MFVPIDENKSDHIVSDGKLPWRTVLLCAKNGDTTIIAA